MSDFVSQGGKHGGQTVWRIIIKGLMQTRGGGNGNVVVRLTMNPFHSLIPFQLVLMCVFKTSCKSLSKARHLRDLLDKVVKVHSSEKHTATSCKKLAESNMS